MLNIPEEFKQKTLQEYYYYVMLFKDLIERYDISNASVLKYFLNRVLVNVGKPTSVNEIYNELKSNGYKTSKNTLYSFLAYSEAIYMNFSLPKFDFSLRKRENAEKKNYFIDNGLINALSFKFSDDYGMLLENCIFLHLRRQYKEQVFYFKDNKECDFVIFEKNKVQQLIQVCYDVEDNETLKREVESLKYACKKLGVTEGTIVTFDNIENELLEDGIQIEFIPAWKFVLGYNF